LKYAEKIPNLIFPHIPEDLSSLSVKVEDESPSVKI